MKTIFFMTLIAAILVTTVSCKSKEQKDAENYMNKIEKTMKENSPANTDGQQKTSTASGSIHQGLENIVGEWEFTGMIGDNNGNDQLDEDERKEAKKPYEDYMQLNSDGSAVFYVFKAKGHFEIKTNETSGKKYLTLFDKDNTRHPVGAIMSVSKDELIIMNKFGGDTITIWKRV